MRVQKLRLKQAWSQQQLAEMSGLSVRTIQRIEGSQQASVESLKSLAAVFEVDFSTLMASPPSHTPLPESTMTSSSLSTSESTRAEQQEANAFRYVRGLRRFYQHVSKYLFVSAILLILKFSFFPEKRWMLWVIAGWGLGLLCHAASLWSFENILDGNWERRQVEKRLGRPL